MFETGQNPRGDIISRDLPRLETPLFGTVDCREAIFRRNQPSKTTPKHVFSIGYPWGTSLAVLAHGPGLSE